MKATNTVRDPSSSSNFRAPTIPEGETTSENKYDFVNCFDRPPFVGEVKVPVLNRFKKRKLDHQGKPMYETKLRENGMPDPSFIKKNNLDYSSHPSNWFRAFLPSSLTDTWTGI